jgi:outer membrane protein assembly factor BamB
MVDSWRNTILWATSYLADDGVVHAHSAGAAAEAWTFDVNTRLSWLSEPLTRPYFRVIDDDLYVGAEQHVFRLDPADGSVLAQWDLAALAGLPWEAGSDSPCFFSGGLNLGTFSRDESTLVVGFERRIIAMDRASGALLWHSDPGSYPHPQHPVVASGTVYLLTRGDPAAAQVRDDAASGCDCGVGAGSQRPLPLALGVGYLIWRLRRHRICRKRRIA